MNEGNEHRPFISRSTGTEIFMTKPHILGLVLALVFAPFARAQYQDWQHSGSLFILTTPEGADLPASAAVEDFPLLLRINKHWFDFSQANARGEDLRFATSTGQPLAYQIEHWDSVAGEASVWIRIPVIKGNARQEIRMHWGKADAVSLSSGKAVFNESNGYLSVWHLGDEVLDEVGTLESKDEGTTPVAGMVGKARHFPGKHGIFGGDKIPNYPSAGSSHTTSLWFRAEQPNGTIIGWGNEGGGRGSKIRMQFRSPPHIHIDSDFSDIKALSRLPMQEWVHVAHTYGDGPRKIYLNGKLDNEATTTLDIKSPARLWLGGWYHHYDFVGDLDEVRVSRVARSADWIKLQFENQKPLQTVVGTVVQPGSEFGVSPAKATVAEGASADFSAQAGGAQKVYWATVRDGRETLAAVDQLRFTFAAGRVTGDTSVTLRFKAVYPDSVEVIDIPITITEALPDPEFTLHAPAAWDGRSAIEVTPRITNLAALKAAGAGELKTEWELAQIAVIKEIAPEKLLLTRAQNSGQLIVTATLSNGGEPVTHQARIMVTEPQRDPWIARTPDKNEMPQDGQFYARDDTNEGTLHCNGVLAAAADEVYLRVYADDKLEQTKTAKVGEDKVYALSAQLKAGLIKYRTEFGTRTAGRETVLHTAQDLVCGDAYLMDGQSNALATDTGEESPPLTHEWIRSYAHPRHYRAGETQNLWCRPVWKARQQEHQAELGWWGMELAKRLVESQQVPIFIVNGAVGGTRIDQHQRNEENPTDLDTIYGRMLWRVREARLTSGIRGILWHQGENDQGAAGPDGGYGWETYQRYFVEMSAAWKRDFPNVQHYYVFQIYPNACSMGGGHGDMLREVQRSLPRLYSNMDVLSTLGVEPPGGCHFPLVGWEKFASLVQPLIERDFYGATVTRSITSPNLKRAYFTSAAKSEIALEFDQPVEWDDALVSEFYLDDAPGQVASGAASGNVLTLQLTKASAAKRITYLKELSWSQQRLLKGANGIAALTFCNVPILLTAKDEP
jgi:hypothetical protein